MRGLEPPCLAAPVPKTGVSAISPHPRCAQYTVGESAGRFLLRTLRYASCPPGRARTLHVQYTVRIFFCASLENYLARSSSPLRHTLRSASCPPGRARTFDLGLKRPLLYQLSYRRIFCFFSRQNLTVSVLCKTVQNKVLVPRVGVEPTRACAPGILSPLRLPFRHLGVR